MKSMQLLQDLQFNDEQAHAQGLFVDRHGRVLRFALKPGQHIRQHHAPDSPLYLVVLKGRGMFTGEDNQEREFGPNSLIIFQQGEYHTVRALDEELIFVGFLHGALGNELEREGGLLGHEQQHE